MSNSVPATAEIRSFRGGCWYPQQKHQILGCNLKYGGKIVISKNWDVCENLYISLQSFFRGVGRGHWWKSNFDDWRNWIRRKLSKFLHANLTFLSIFTSRTWSSFRGSALSTTPLLNSCVGWFLWAVLLSLLSETNAPVRLWNRGKDAILFIPTIPVYSAVTPAVLRSRMKTRLPSGHLTDFLVFH